MGALHSEFKKSLSVISALSPSEWLTHRSSCFPSVPPSGYQYNTSNQTTSTSLYHSLTILRYFLSYQDFRPSQGPNLLHVLCGRGGFSLRRSGKDMKLTGPSSTDSQKEISWNYTSTFPHALMRWYLIVKNDIFVFAAVHLMLCSLRCLQHS